MTNTHPAHRRLLLAAGLGSLLVTLGACSSTASSTASASQAASQSTAASTAASESAEESTEESADSGPTVTITGTSFGVDEITVPAGQQLTVKNASNLPHTFTEGENGTKAADARVDEQVAAGEEEVIDFPEPGDYHITCTIHAVMNMVVHVE
jgi:plastocyanin